MAVRDREICDMVLQFSLLSDKLKVDSDDTQAGDGVLEDCTGDGKVPLMYSRSSRTLVLGEA